MPATTIRLLCRVQRHSRRFLMIFCHKSKAVCDWIGLRASAVVNIPLVLWLVYSVISLQGADYATFTSWLAQPVNAILMIIFILSTFYHAALGSHEVIEDYVHEE